MAEDRIYSAPLHRVGDFEFDDAVADVFPDMIRRSVPGYSSMLSMIARVTERYARAGTQLYDLGCSLGAGTVLLRDHAPEDCRVVAVDNSEAMIERLRSRLDAENHDNAVPRVDLHLADLRQVNIRNASIVILNLTLQFIPPDDRDDVICRVAAGLQPGGAVLLSEKICFDDPDQQSLSTELHLDFKRAHGYSELEIAQKRTAIENRLIPETMQQHMDRLRGAGFRRIVPWFLCFNFASILAVK